MIIFVYAIVIAVILCGLVSFAVHIRQAFINRAHNKAKTRQLSVDNSGQK